MAEQVADNVADLLIEVGCEELPASYIAPALKALEAGLLKLLKGIEFAGSQTFSTPRRLCVVVEGLAPGKPKNERVMSGPGLGVAQKDGEWTRAAMGFARGKGASVEDLQIIDGPRGKQIAVVVTEGGETVQELVAAGLDKLVMGLPFKKSMTWKAGTRWARPIRRITAVYDGAVVPVNVGGIDAGRVVAGHRRSKLPPVAVSSAEDYLAALDARWVMADRGARKARIEAQLMEAAAAAGVSLQLDAGLVEEVTDLVEWPQVVTGRFEEHLLELPPRLLITSMKVHQRTFPTYKSDTLSNIVLIVSNAPEGDAELIADGNARVLAARFHDATFFFAEDRKLSLEQHAEDLSKMRWVRGLGTMAQKQARIASLAAALAPMLGADVEVARRAGALCKSDLLTQMVGEFPELQGHIGKLYALNRDEPAAVGQAIEEHYLPRFSGDTLPVSLEGRAVALADRLDTLVGCFGIGLKPKGSADPQGLRRAANAVVAILLDHGKNLSLSPLFDAAIDGYPDRGAEGALKLKHDEVQSSLSGFTLGRLRSTLREQGYATDVVDAVLAGTGRPGMSVDDAVSLRERAVAITEMSRSGDFADLMTTFKRVLNITKDHDSGAFDTAALTGPEERTLVKAVQSLIGTWADREDVPVGEILEGMRGLRGPVDAFFEAVMVMAEEPELRAARLGLLTVIAGIFLAVADFRKIAT